MASDHITADMVDSSEVAFLSIKYNVQGVPHTVINEEPGIVGVQPDMEFAAKLSGLIRKRAL